jgi:hypothetical protein
MKDIDRYCKQLDVTLYNVQNNEILECIVYTMQQCDNDVIIACDRLNGLCDLDATELLAIYDKWQCSL